MTTRRNKNDNPEQLVALACCLVHIHRAVLPAVAPTKSTSCHISDDDIEVNCSLAPEVEETPHEELVYHNMEDSRLNLLALQSDIEAEQHSEHEQQKLAKQLLVTLGSLLHQADRELTTLQDNNLLGSAIVRGCKEIADVISTIAENLSHDQVLAEASLQDFSDCTDLRLLQPDLLDDDNDSNDHHHRTLVLRSSDQQPNHEQIAILVDLLHDIEYSLRSVEQEEADEIADLAVSVALVFVQSLEHAHSQLTPKDLLPPSKYNHGSSRRIEFLSDDDKAEFDEENPPPPSPVSHPVPRSRCLWPPLAPAATDFLQWAKEELFHRQHWAVSTAATITLWPVALTAAMWSVPALAMDHLLQQTYEHFEESPVIVGAEVGAAQLQRTVTLSWKTAVALAKPTLRVVKRQVKKHGPGLIAAAKQKACTPVSTLHEATHGAMWCTSQLLDFCGEQWQRLQQENPSEVLL